MKDTGIDNIALTYNIGYEYKLHSNNADSVDVTINYLEKEVFIYPILQTSRNNTQMTSILGYQRFY